MQKFVILDERSLDYTDRLSDPDKFSEVCLKSATILLDIIIVILIIASIIAPSRALFFGLIISLSLSTVFFK